MKRMLSSAVCLIFIILALCACGNESSGNTSSGTTGDNAGASAKANALCSYYNYNTDCQFVFTNPPIPDQAIAKCDTGYYILDKNGMLYFTDISSGAATPLCNKPNCIHSPSDFECNAHITSYDNTIVYNNGYLYYSYPADVNSTGGGIEIYRLKPDGSGSTELIYQSEKSGGKWIIHRDYLYRAYGEYESSDNIEDADKQRLYVEKISLKNTSDSEVIYDTEKYLQNVSFQYLAAFDEYLYYSVYFGDKANTFCYSIKSGKTKELLIDGASYDLRVHPIADKLVFKTGFDLNVYQCDLDAGNVKKLASVEDENIQIYADGTYIYEDNYLLHYADELGIDKPNAEKHILKVYDKDYRPVDTLEFAFDSAAPSICDDKYFINDYYDQQSKEVSFAYFDKALLGSLNGATWNETELEILS